MSRTSTKPLPDHVAAGSAAARFAPLSTPLVPTKTVLLTADPAAADPVAAKREELRRAFHQTCAIYERLFALIRDDASYYERHEPLRHPLIFYFAHPAVFYINKLTAGRYIPARLDARLEAMMAVGVDEMSWDDLNSAHYDWPSVATVRSYRAAMREFVDEFIQSMPLALPITPDQPAWVILMGIEHERIHLETSSVIMRMMPLDELRAQHELSAEEQRLWGMGERSGGATTTPTAGTTNTALMRSICPPSGRAGASSPTPSSSPSSKTAATATKRSGPTRAAAGSTTRGPSTRVSGCGATAGIGSGICSPKCRCPATGRWR